MLKKITYKRIEDIQDYIAVMINEGWTILKVYGKNNDYRMIIGKGI